MNTKLKSIKKKLKDIYGFSHNDNIVRKVLMSPNQFLKTTFKEQQLKAVPKREWEIFQERYLHRKIEYPTKVYKSQKEFEQSVLNKKNIQAIKEILIGKRISKYDIPIPFLEYDEKGRPIGHEGRHTMKALKELGIKKIRITKVKRK
jgi:hypothetical protein